jgi:hypothetical protein
MKNRIGLPCIALAAICLVQTAGAGENSGHFKKLDEPGARATTVDLRLGARGSAIRKTAASFAGVAEHPESTFTGAAERKASRTAEPSSILDFRSDDTDLANAAGTFASASLRASGRRSGLTSGREATEIRAAFIRPREGSKLEAVPVFEWTEGAPSQMYWIWIGSCRDCADIADVGTSDRIYTATLPTDGRAIYVTLFTLYDGAWYWYDYTFRGPDTKGTIAEMTSPAYGDTLQRTQTFRWSVGSNVSQYYLWIGSCQDCTDILDESQGLERSKTVTLPNDGRTTYLTLFSYMNGAWYWADYQYRAASQASSRQVSVTITNRLARAVNIFVNGEVVGSVPASETRTHSASLTDLQVKWELIAPVLSGRAIGDTMGGSFTMVSAPSGEYSYEIDNVVGSNWYFAPFITNRTGVGLLIEVNGGLEAQNRCNCTAPNGSTNVAPGYYKLFTNSNVRLWRGDSNYTGRYRFWGTDSDGRVAGSRLPDAAETKSGILRITATTAP